MFRVVRDFIDYLLSLGFVRFDRHKIAREDALATGLVVIRKTHIWINPAIAPLPVPASLEPVSLPQAVAFQPVSPARLGDAAGEAGFNDCDLIALDHH
jgi:hypothetical protein